MDKRNSDKRMGDSKAINFDMKKRFATGTPPHDRCYLALLDNTPVEFDGAKFKIVSASRIKGTMTDEFFLKKIY